MSLDLTSAFLTGSHAYGTPRVSSDIDLAVTITDKEASKLASLADHCDGSRGDSLRFGKLNLIILEPKQFEAWRIGTQKLIAERPVTRERAIEVLTQCENEAKANVEEANAAK